jgi:hypothetical protein
MPPGDIDEGDLFMGGEAGEILSGIRGFILFAIGDQCTIEISTE